MARAVHGVPSRGVLSLVLGLSVCGAALRVLCRRLCSLCPGPLPRVHDTPWSLGLLGRHQPPSQGRDMGPTGWTPSLLSSCLELAGPTWPEPLQTWPWPGLASCLLPLSSSCSILSLALPLLLDWGWGLSSVLLFVDPEARREREGHFLGPGLGSLCLSWRYPFRGLVPGAEVTLT